MSAWQEIKNIIIREQTETIDGIIIDITKSIGNLKTPRNYWTKPLEEWVNEQIHKDSAFKLTAQEYSQLKKLVVDLQESFYWHCGDEADIINDFRNEFNKAYTLILESKEVDLKIEAAALLIETRNFDFTPLANWYLTTWHLPPEKFHEAIGSFWGDTWRSALKGAALGATAAGIPTGGSAAVPGGLIGGLAGGAYGGGKNVLQRVWNWRQSQNNFEDIKKQTLENLKKLKYVGSDFDISPNFIQFIDSVINELMKVNAYRIPQPGVYRPAEAPKMNIPSTETPTTQPETPAERPPASATPPPTEAGKEKAIEDMEAQAKAKAAARQAHFTINNVGDILRIHKKAKDDIAKAQAAGSQDAEAENTLLKLSHLINIFGQNAGDIVKYMPEFKSQWEKITNDNNWALSDEDAANELKLAEKQFKQLEAEELAKAGEKAENIPAAPPAKEPEMFSDEELAGQSVGRLRQYMKARGIDWDKDWPKIWWTNKPPNANSKAARKEFVAKLKAYLQTKKESVSELLTMLREGKSLPVKHQLNSIPVEERVNYFRSLLKS